MIDEHPSAFTYDWRARFGMSLWHALDVEPDWRETCLLAVELAGDPSSRVAAALAGWSHAWPTEAWILADLYDVFVRANSTRRSTRPYPRPNAPQPKRFGRAIRSQRDIRAALAARGHNIAQGG